MNILVIQITVINQMSLVFHIEVIHSNLIINF